METTLDQQRTASRLVVEFLADNGSSSNSIKALRFLLDGVDIGKSLVSLGLCQGGDPPICPPEQFLAFLRGPQFWGTSFTSTFNFNSSEKLFNKLCFSPEFASKT